MVVLDVTTRQPLPIDPGIASRRVFYLPSGELVAAPYGAGLDLWTPAGTRRHVDLPQAHDATVPGGSTAVWLLTRSDRVMRWERGVLDDLLPGGGAHTLAVSPDGALVALAAAGGVRIHDLRDGTSRSIAIAGSEVTALLVDPARAWLAIGQRSGTVEIWDLADLTVVARLRGHDQRISGLGLTADGLLWSTSWDGGVALWSLAALTRPRDELRRVAEATWGDGLVGADASAPAAQP